MPTDPARMLALASAVALGALALWLLAAGRSGEREWRVGLPGVGRKTANVVMNEAFGIATFAVDTHVLRLSNRSGLAPGKDVLAVEKKLDKKVPEPFRMHAHHWLILHGRYVCLARKPKCHICPVYDYCRFKDKEKIKDMI